MSTSGPASSTVPRGPSSGALHSSRFTANIFYLYFPGPHLAFIVVVFCHYPQFRQGLIHIQYRYLAGTVLDEVKRSPLFCMAVLRYRI